MEDKSGQFKIKEQHNWDNQKFSNKEHVRGVSDIVNSDLDKTSYREQQQKSKFSLGIAPSRQITEATYRPSVYGVTPGLVRPFQGNQFMFGGKTHTFANVQDTNLPYNQAFHPV